MQEVNEPFPHIASHDVEAMTLSELFPHWSNMLWLLGMRPMLHSMLQLNLTMSENLVLRQLQHHTLTIAEVGTELSITHSAASRAVDRLVRDGYITRVENAADRRQKLLTLTAQGEALMHDLQSTFIAGIEHLAAPLPPDDQEHFRRLIARMVAANCLTHQEPSSEDFSEEAERR